MLVKEIMTRNVVTVRPNVTIKQLIDILSQHRINGVPVVDGGGDLVGVITRTDLLRMLKDINYWGAIEKVKPGMGVLDALLKEKESLTVSKKMTNAVDTVSEEDPIERVVDLMCKHSIHTIPVVKDDKLVGVVGATDIIKVTLS